MKLINTDLDIDIRLVTVGGVITAIISGVSVEQINADPKLKENIQELIRIMIKQYGDSGLTPEEL